MSAADAHAHAYDEAKHPRGARGRFAGGGTATIVQPRSLTRGEAWQRTGAKLPGIPIGYTGSREKELPVGSFTHHQLKAQVPDAMSADDHRELVGSLVSVIANERSGAIEKGHERRLIPDGTERHTINRAYNHAAMHSLHSFGTHDYDFKMDDHLKAELTPLVPFMRYAHRRVKDVMLAKHKGKWRPYREAFGQPFNDLRRDKITGAIRKRVRPNQELIKRISPVTVLATGGTAALAALGVGAAIHNRLKEARDKDGRWKKSAVTSRLTGRDYVENPLTTGEKIGLGAVGAGLGLAALVGPRAFRQGELSAATATVARGTGVLNVKSAARSWRDLGAHAADIVTQPTAVGKVPTGKQLRRQFARDSFIARERLIAVGHDGKVLTSLRGQATSVGGGTSARARKKSQDAMNQLKSGNVARTYHNHPVDAVPSEGDRRMADRIARHLAQYGKRPTTEYVYGISRVKGGANHGKTRVRLTRYDGNIDNLEEMSIAQQFAAAFRDRPDPTEARWIKAKKTGISNYRTHYVEKLAKAEARDHKGRWTSGGIAAAAAVGIGAGLALLALPRALRQRELAAYVPRANLDVRNTKVLNTASLIRGWRHLGNHAVDIVTNPTGAGKRPTGKQIRRQFARDAFMARERTITVGRDGKVRQSIRGTATAGVRIDDPKLAAYATDAEAGNVGRMYHNHPVDAAPSLQDAEVHNNLKEMARAHGRSAPVTHVYGFGRVATGAKAGKTRVRVTRFDDADDAVIDRSPFDIPILHEDFFDWSPEEQSAHYDTIRDSMVKKPSRPNPKEADWKAARAAGKSNYRTRYVEKLHKRFHSATHPAAYAMLPDALKHLVPPPNPLEMAAIEHDPTMPPHVKAIMPMTRNILSSIGWANKGPQRQNARRHARSKLIADPNVPLSHALAKAWAQQARGAGGRWVAGAGAGAIVLGGALAYKDAKRLWRIHHIHSLLRRNARLGQPADTRGTTHLRLRSLLPDAHVHLGDIVHRRAARGKTPNEHVVGRQFLRDSAMVRERMILTDKAGKVLLNIPGDAAGVAFRSMSEANRFLRHMTRGEIATTYHNHPLDAVPSISDVLAHRMITEAAQAAGADEPVSYVYSHGRIGPKTRTRITRYDGKIEADGNDAEAGRNLTVADWEKAQGTGSTYHTTFVEKLAKRWAENRTG